jgi:uncharacterized protein (DUF952 family)
MNWGYYLAKGCFNEEYADRKIFHLCEKKHYIDQITSTSHSYIPPTFTVDGGFVHATENPSQLLAVANHFYQKSAVDWICIELSPVYLGCRLIYEGASGVGEGDNYIPPMPWVKEGEKFPHVYGPIPGLSVSRVFDVIRNKENGEFLKIQDLC